MKYLAVEGGEETEVNGSTPAPLTSSSVKLTGSTFFGPDFNVEEFKSKH